MFEEFLKREKAIFDILNRLSGEKLTFVVIGGYGVSAYKHRFSVDADIVVSHEDIGKFEAVMVKNSFKKTASKELENIYSSKFIRYEKEDSKISIDILVGGVGVRQTGAAFSYEILLKNSSLRKITGTTSEVKALVPKREVLIAMKLQSGRLTDLRDVVALSKGSDVKLVKAFLQSGDKNRIRDHLTNLSSILDTKGFMDSFKGVFVEKKYDVDVETVKKICKLADEL